eukprot:4374464-Alexandrium_andersonii.AAC.1
MRGVWSAHWQCPSPVTAATAAPAATAVTTQSMLGSVVSTLAMSIMCNAEHACQHIGNVHHVQQQQPDTHCGVLW